MAPRKNISSPIPAHILIQKISNKDKLKDLNNSPKNAFTFLRYGICMIQSAILANNQPTNKPIKSCCHHTHPCERNRMALTPLDQGTISKPKPPITSKVAVAKISSVRLVMMVNNHRQNDQILSIGENAFHLVV
jgi:hypothetical protein